VRSVPKFGDERKMALKRSYVAAVVLIIVIVVGGWYWYSQQEALARQKATIIIGTTDKITVLDPAKAYDFYTWEIFTNIGEGLMKYKPGTTDLEPGLADPAFGGGKGYTVSPDGLVYTFKLRAGLKFTDGTPINATVVKWSLERVARIKEDPSWFVTDFISKIDVVDALTVKITLLDPVSYFPAIMAVPTMFPVSPKAYPADSIKDSTVGCGPYKITNWVRDVELDLEVNPDYYGAKPKSTYCVIKFFKDATTMRLALERGEIDVAWKTLRPTDIVDLKKKPDLKVVEGPGAYIRYIVIRVGTPPFDNVYVRKALACAIDRKALADRVFMGTVEPLYSMVPMGMWSHIDALKAEYGEFNLTKAKEYLKAAGYSETKKLTFELWYTPTHYGDTEADVATILKDSFEKTGMISVTLKSAEWPTYVDYLYKGTMPIYLLGWYPDYMDPDDYLWPFYHSGNVYSGYNSTSMDNLLYNAKISVNIEDRTGYYKSAQELAAKDLPYIPMFQGKLIVVSKPIIKGIVLDPLMLLRYYLIYKE
jgi:peptide/nickel transport system substrate-binding protein